MSIENQIVDWASTRPPWQRVVLRRIAQGEQLLVNDYADIGDGIIADTWGETETFQLEDMPMGTGPTHPLRLLEIRNVQHVNALVQDSPLTFAPDGLTVVYGDNASGKSGYARLIKQMVVARHNESILTDIFTDRGASIPGAEVKVQVDDATEEFSWPSSKPAAMGQVSFFDEACGDAYITTESEIGYRPSALFVMDGLIRACDGIRIELDRRIADNTTRANNLPSFAEGTTAARLLRSLSAQTSPDDIEIAARLAPDIDSKISELTIEEVRLRATDPSKERERLRANEEKLISLSRHIRNCSLTLGKDGETLLVKLQEELAAKKGAALMAAGLSFEHEPLPGVGSATWREMWEAARQFAAEACPEHAFPVSGEGARCVLCHQQLTDDASERLKRFERFVQDKTQQDLDNASEQWTRATERLTSFEAQPADILTALNYLAPEYEHYVEKYRGAVQAFSDRQKQLVNSSGLDQWREPNTPEPIELADEADALASEAKAATLMIDDSTFSDQIRMTTAARLELEAAKTFSAIRETVLDEVERLKARSKLDHAKESTDTTWISRKSAELTRDYVTSVIRDRFTRESDRLRLERVTLEDTGGRKGALRHQPAFVGAIQEVDLPRVLSEGEQTALGLAGFFTEVYLSSSRSAIVLDDPVSSLDHVRRSYVANRLVEFAKERQVIVFTHDVAFVTDFRIASDRENVQFAERSIERRLTGQPGVCRSTHPWKARDVAQRLNHLAEELSRTRRDQGDWDQDRYERETSEWAGKLSETWERMINFEVVGQVVDRGTQEVRPRMFRVLARITEEDDREFQASYARCSRWARRHDKSVEINYVAPAVDEMEAELNGVRAWWDRIRRYRT